jgi:hypothetical protein
VATLATLVTVTIYLHSRPGILDRVDQAKGWDFPQFYAMGVLAAEGRVSELQSGASISEVIAARVAAGSRLLIVPVYGPQVALFFRPFGRTSYVRAMATWTLISIALYVAAVGVALRYMEMRTPRRVVWFVAMSWPGLFVLCWFAQLSAATALCLVGVYCFAARDRWAAAGAVLGVLAFKPHLAVVVALWFVYERRWAGLLCAGASAAGQIALAWWYAGSAVMGQYWATLLSVGGDAQTIQAKPHMFQSFRHFYILLLGDGETALVFYVLTGVVALGLVVAVWRRRAALPVRYAAAIAGTVVTSPHFYAYDLLILLPVLLMACGDYVETDRPTAASWAFLALYLLPVASPLVSLGTSLQLVPLALLAILVWLAVDPQSLEHGLTADAPRYFAGAK